MFLHKYGNECMQIQEELELLMLKRCCKVLLMMMNKQFSSDVVPIRKKEQKCMSRIGILCTPSKRVIRPTLIDVNIVLIGMFVVYPNAIYKCIDPQTDAAARSVCKKLFNQRKFVVKPWGFI